MRLIDADEFVKKFRRSDANTEDENHMCSVVRWMTKKEPTAYDVDKVVKQLEEEKEYSEADFDRYTREHYPDSDCDDWFCSGLERAIEIVKGGGVDGEARI